MRSTSISWLAIGFCFIATNAWAALFEITDFPGRCKDAPMIDVPTELQGRYTDPATTGWAQVGPHGFTKIDWKGFNFYSKGFAEKGYCVRQEFIADEEGTSIVRLTLELSEGGLIGNSDSHTISVVLNKADSVYTLSSESSGTLRIGFIPLGGTTMMPTKANLIRKALPAEEVRSLSSN